MACCPHAEIFQAQKAVLDAVYLPLILAIQVQYTPKMSQTNKDAKRVSWASQPKEATQGHLKTLQVLTDAGATLTKGFVNG